VCLALSPVPGFAAGINLAWDNCGREGQPDMAASCVETPVPYVLVGSVVPPPGLTSVVGFQAILDIQVEGDALPSWWEMGQGCRSGKMSALWDFTSGPYSCTDLWEGQGVIAMMYYDRDPRGNRARISIIAAVPTTMARAMNPGTEYYLFKLVIQKSGTMSCAGCRTPACIQLSEVRIVQPDPMPDKFVRERADFNHATWQGGIGSPDSDLSACRADAVQNRTWGQIKNAWR
jgi:hypothetical protein